MNTSHCHKIKIACKLLLSAQRKCMKMPEFLRDENRDPFEPSCSDKGLSLDAFWFLKNPETKMKKLPLCIYFNMDTIKKKMFWKR